MDTIDNQKIVIVSKAEADKDHPYSVINLEALDSAVATLKNNDFKLWMYIAKNQNHFTFALSRVAFCRWSGTSVSTYHRAVTSLIEKVYLVPSKSNSNTYTFYEAGINYTTKDDLTVYMAQDKQEEIANFKM